MKSFHNDPAIKQKYLNRVIAHQNADEIIKGVYWENGKGCAIGCTIHDSDHLKYESELGIPQWLAKVEDRIFEGLSNENAKDWPRQFLDSIPIGVDLEKIKAPFLIFILESTLDKFDHKKFPKVKESIERVIELYRTGEADKQKFAYAAAAAAYAADAAYAAAAAAYAADAAAYAAAADAAYAAAADAAYAAAYAADAADAAAYAAAYAAAAYAARQNAYKKFADKLLELVRDCK